MATEGIQGDEGNQEIIEDFGDQCDIDFNDIVDTLVHRTLGIGYIDYLRRRGHPRQYPGVGRHFLQREIKVIEARASDILGFSEGEYVGDFETWVKIEDSNKLPFRDWRLQNNGEFRKRWEGFLEEIGGTPVSQDVSKTVRQYWQEEEKERIKHTQVEPITTKIEDLTEEELRDEIIRRVRHTLGRLAMSPVADSSAIIGFNRLDGETALSCSYFRYIKIMGEDEELRGVQVELLVLSNTFHKSFRAFDGDFASSDNRYYFIPLDPSLAPILSTESFWDRVEQINPGARDQMKFQITDFPETYQKVFRSFLDEPSGKSQRVANLQDLRDALAVVRQTDWFMRGVIYRTPPEYWGRPGFTE